MEENEATQPTRFFGLPGYPYQKLQPGECRMIDLDPGQLEEDLYIKFKIDSVYDEYEAFSYGGADGPSSTTETLNVGQEGYRIPSALGDELRKLRLKDKRRSIWIDALCIDPGDSGELRFQYVSVPPWEDVKQPAGIRTVRTTLPVLGIKALVHDNWNGRREIPITLGGLVFAGDVTCILTTGHAFLPHNTAEKEPRGEEALEAGGEDFFEWSIDDCHVVDASKIKHVADLSEDLDKVKIATGMLDGRETFPDSSPGPSSSVGREDCLRSVITFPYWAVSSKFDGGPLSSFDFTLLFIQKHYEVIFQGMANTNRLMASLDKSVETEPQPALMVKKRNPTYPVIAVLGSSGIVRGSISSTPTSVYDPSFSTFTEIWTAYLEGEVVRGDCGSWVLDLETGCLLGHIVSGSSDMGGVNIFPAKEIFDNFERLTGTKLSLFAGHLSKRKIYGQYTSTNSFVNLIMKDLLEYGGVKIETRGESEYVENMADKKVNFATLEDWTTPSPSTSDDNLDSPTAATEEESARRRTDLKYVTRHQPEDVNRTIVLPSQIAHLESGFDSDFMKDEALGDGSQTKDLLTRDIDVSRNKDQQAKNHGVNKD
ncbi:hypothetical protein B0O99DRAFT_641861 [Bisporella sp. PMI_857]|nr:hypothetical protein B0O99DRAFT_641861 [Bisporella sp. PMI_857]